MSIAKQKESYLALQARLYLKVMKVYDISSKEIWKACKFFWVHFLLPPF